jgi:TRAP-type C4-dicarboxylate transport system permease small subunit
MPLRFLDKTARAMTTVGEFAIVAMMATVALDVTMRYLFLWSFDAAADIVANYFMVGIAYMPLAEITRDDSHLSARFLTDRMSDRGREILEGFIALVLCVFMAVVTWETAVAAIDMTRQGEMMQGAVMTLPIWPSRWLLPAGSLTMTFYALVVALWKFGGRGTGGQSPSSTPA